MPTLPVPGRLYDTWRSSYNRSTSHVELVASHSSSSSTSSLPHLSTWNLGGRITSSVKKVVEVFTWTGLCRWRRFRSHGLRRARLMGRSWITKS
ncbi:hypothetical protein BHE74_00059498 [Ensete ventricosum]|nr:hypothetical protein BHE74_00059498 [Ensete ventricosum]